MHHRYILALILSFATAAQADCQLANNLLVRANEMRGVPIEEKIAVLNQALENCPTNPHVHNNLANLLGDQGNYEAAVAHYKQALELDPQLAVAWYGLGDTYKAWGQLPQALEAYLHICTQYDDAKAAATKLLQETKLNEVEPGQLIDEQTLLVLLDRPRHKQMVAMINTCGIKVDGKRAIMESKLILRNLEFRAGKTNLAATALNRKQIQAISSVLKQLPGKITLGGHSDNKPFRNVSPEENERMSLELSQQRAEAVKIELVRRGVAPERITARGFGSTEPIDAKNQARNRRVEIVVE